MKNRIYLMMLLTIIIFLVPSICFAESKELMSEYCDIYKGDVKNKKNLDAFKQSVSVKAKEGVLKELVKESQLSNTTPECIKNVLNKYYEKVDILRRMDRAEEKGRKICEKVKVTLNSEEIIKYLNQETCLRGWGAGKNYTDWCYDIDKVIPVKTGRLNIGLILETQNPNINARQKEEIENEEEKQFLDMVGNNPDKYDVLDKSVLLQAAEEHKISLNGITDNDILQLGKLLSLDVIVHRLIYKDSKVTKVRKINTGKIILSNTYKTETVSEIPESEASDWVRYGEDKRGTLHYYKKGKVDSDSGIIKVLNKWVFSKKEISEAIQYRRENRLSTRGYDKLSYMVYLSEMDCSSQSERMLYLFLYNQEGKALFSHTYKNPEWTIIQPESNGETILKAVCK
jgi:hypothetical protein